MVWSDQNEHLIKKLEYALSKSNNSKVSLHIFVPKDSASVPRIYPWVVTHESLTSEDDAAKVGLIVHILQKYDLTGDGAVKNGRRISAKRNTIYIVQNETEDYGELVGMLRKSRWGSNVKVLLMNSLESPLISPEKSRCKHCNGMIDETMREDSPRGKNGNDFMGSNDNHALNEKTNSLDSKGSPQNESSFCLLCGKHQQRLHQREDLNVKFSRHFNNKEPQGIYDKIGQLQNGVAADSERKVHLFNEYNAIRSQQPGCPSCSPCICRLRGSWSSDRDPNEYRNGIECRYCREKLLLVNPSRLVSDELTTKEDRSKSSQECSSRENCHCSEDGAHVCLTCLLVKLARPPQELKLGRSESAPNIFFHGEFRDDKCALMEVGTLEKGTSTEDDLQKFLRVTSIDKSTEVRALTAEKSTNTPVEKSTNTMHEKSTSTDDLEVKIVEKVEETPVEESMDVSLDGPFEDKKSSLMYSCMFCPEKAYRSKDLLDVHMKNNHKKCNCPCQQYFRTREDYLAHFYFVYPLPCMVDKKCPERFRSLYYQSIHHKDAHYALKPFFCIPCYRSNEDTSPGKKVVAFKDIASLRIHASSHGHDPQDMYLASIDSKPDDSRLPFSMRCSGINYC